MAAPSMEGAGRSKSVEKPAKVPEQLDLTSPLFDPLQALTSKEVFLPVPDAKPFDNLAKYESFTKVKPKPCQQVKSDNVKENERNVRDKKTKASHKKLEEDISSQLSEIRVEPKATDTNRNVNTKKSETEKSGHGTRNKSVISKKEKELQAARKKRRMRNVLTRMAEFDKGPLNFLKRCVENRHVVKVWTRSACEWRGFCTGYIIAFDIHFNLAMMDVDETYRKPRVQDRREEFRKKVSAEDVSLVRKVDDQLSKPEIAIDIDSEAGNTDQTSSNVDQASNVTDLVTESVVNPSFSDVVSASLTISNDPMCKEESAQKAMKSLTVDTKSETRTSKSAAKASSSESVMRESNAAESRDPKLSTTSVAAESRNPNPSTTSVASESRNPKLSTTSVDSSVRALTRLSIEDTQTSKLTDSLEKNLQDKVKEKTSTVDKKFRSKLCDNKSSEWKERIKGKETDINKGEKVVKLLQSEKLSSKSNENDTNSSSSSDSSDTESVNKVEISKSEKSVMKSKKKVVSLEESSSVKLKHRHVNQLFIRGDNVVSIGILYY